jgi:XTP/dITP diphosphohydrolase/tetrapyrrole methylase family protein/MazG family protein/ATP diphosphatase
MKMKNPQQRENEEAFSRLVAIMERLRAPDGCPWDREQDFSSLRRYIVEEAYELVEAIEGDGDRAVLEESGDLLLQVVFISQIASEKGLFSIREVLDGICSKLVQRHPHVFGDLNVADSDEVMRNWEAIKTVEKKKNGADSSILSGIPRSMPSLLKAYRIQERAAKFGFDWPAGDATPVLAKVDEELSEIREALSEKSAPRLAEEIGDLLFATVNLSRHSGVNPEEALQQASRKFAERFRLVEHSVAETGKPWKEFSLDELDDFWEKAKQSC